MVAHEFHHLRAEFLAFWRAVADAGVVHQVGQAHDAQADAAGAVGGFFELRHRRDVGVGLDHVVQEDGGEDHALAQFLPIHRAVRAEVLGQVDRAEAAVFEWTKPLLAAVMRNQAVGDQAVGHRFGQIVNIGQPGGFDARHACFKRLMVRAARFRFDKLCGFALLFTVDKANLLQEGVAVGFVDQQFVIGVSGIQLRSALTIWHAAQARCAALMNSADNAKITEQQLHILQQSIRSAGQPHAAGALAFAEVDRAIGGEQALQEPYHGFTRGLPDAFRDALFLSWRFSYTQALEELVWQPSIG